MTSYDLVLRNGSVVVPGESEPVVADVAVMGDRIAQVGEVPGDAVAREVLDVGGHYVLPGFVDSHVHADARLFDPQVQLACLRQGVTTVIVGQDGLSFAPADPATLDYVTDYFGPVNGSHPGVRHGGFCSVSDLLSTYDLTTRLNVGYLAPHGTIRHVAMGLEDRPPVPDELAAMRRLLGAALDQGALGLSTGLTYLPAAFADTDEVRALCRLVAEVDGVHVTHMRGYDDQVDVGMAETVDIAAHTGCATHVSHYHGPGKLLVDLLDEAVGDRVDLTFDSYPYLYGSSILAGVALPAWVQVGGSAALAHRLGDPDVLRRLRAEWFPRIRDTVLMSARLTHIGEPRLEWAQGLTLPEAAQRSGSSIEDFVCEVFRTAGLDVGCLIAQAGASEDGVRHAMRHPLHMAGSDGIYVGAHPHPRGWGTFARYLGTHTRELADFTWPEAVRHLSTTASRRFGLGDRGEVRPGYAADLAVVDPATVGDTATYERPISLAVGVAHVVVAGSVVLRDGELTESLPGRALRRGRRTAR